MTRNTTQFTVSVARTGAAAALLVTLALAGPTLAATGDLPSGTTTGMRPAQVMVAQTVSPPPPEATRPVPAAGRATKTSGVDRVEARINMLHAKLVITPAQEELWKNVTQVMRDNAQSMEALTKTRATQAKTMTAVDDLKSYAEVTTAHADGLKKFVPVFETLYASMSEAQKAQADTLFRGHHRSRAAAKKMSKSTSSATTAPSNK